MSMEAAYRARLIADPGVAGPLSVYLGAPAVFWVSRPQASTLPAITLTLVTDAREQSFDGLDGLQPGYVQVDIWAASYASARALKEAVIAALLPADEVAGVRFTRGFVTARDLSERTDTAFLFRPSLDFTFHYATA